MGSRIHREVYVRFRGEAMETYHGDMKRRCSLSLQLTERKPAPQREGFCLQDEAGSHQAPGGQNRFNFCSS